MRRRPSSVRRRGLLTIVLQLQPRYRKCVQNGGGACNEVRFARTTSLRTKGACKTGSDARTCNLEVVANRLRVRPAERRGGRRLQMAVSVPRFVASAKASGRRDPAVASSERLARRLRAEEDRNARCRSKRNRVLTAPARSWCPLPGRLATASVARRAFQTAGESAFSAEFEGSGRCRGRIKPACFP